VEYTDVYRSAPRIRIARVSNHVCGQGRELIVAIVIRLALSLMLLATTAVAAPREMAGDRALDPAGQTGWVLLATRMPDMTGFATEHTLVKIFYREVGKSRLSTKNIPFYRKMLFKADVPSDYDDGYGLLRAIELPPGDYVLSHWNFFNGSGVDYFPRDIGELPFTVRAGRVTYVGSFDLVLERGRNAFGVEIAYNPWLVVSDQRERDLAIMLSKFPAIAREQVDVAVPDPGGWRPAGETYSQGRPIVVPGT
jgi:hypothetical protein